MLNKLIKIANSLDIKGFYLEADQIDAFIISLAAELTPEQKEKYYFGRAKEELYPTQKELDLEQPGAYEKYYGVSKPESQKPAEPEEIAMELNEEEKQLVDAGNQIHAFKSIRSRLGLSLKEAKELVDQYFNNSPVRDITAFSHLFADMRKLKEIVDYVGQTYRIKPAMELGADFTIIDKLLVQAQDSGTIFEEAIKDLGLMTVAMNVAEKLYKSGRSWIKFSVNILANEKVVLRFECSPDLYKEPNITQLKQILNDNF